MQAPSGAASIFSRTLQSVFLTLCSERVHGERIWAFPHEEFKERKGSARSLRSGTMNLGKRFARTQLLMELSIHMWF